MRITTPALWVLFVTTLLMIGSQLMQVSQIMKRMVPPEYQLWDHPILNSQGGSSNETMSACLLVYDDNHFLTEWLAFHYQTLPLRRLIIATDPRSRTSPSPILQRWKSHGMNITEWTDDDYFPLSYRRAILRSSLYPNSTNRWVLMHRFRQRFLYRDCMKQLQQEHQPHSTTFQTTKNWVVFMDVDEFLFPNRNYKYHFLLPPPSTTQTVADILHRLSNAPNLRGPCIGLPRLLIGTKTTPSEDDSSSSSSSFGNQQAPPTLPEPLQNDLDNAQNRILSNNSSSSSSSLLTFRWIWHEQLLHHAHNKAGKAMIDLSRISPLAIEWAQIDVHRPLMNVCTIEHHMWAANIDSPLVLHHYVGTLEQFTFRNDARQGKRTVEAYQGYQHVNFSTLPAWDRKLWLVGLVQSLGIETVHSLLHDAGRLETNLTHATAEESYQRVLQMLFPTFVPEDRPLKGNASTANAG